MYDFHWVGPPAQGRHIFPAEGGTMSSEGGPMASEDGGILGILGSPGSLTDPKHIRGPGRSMNCMAEESKCVSENGHLT